MIRDKSLSFWTASLFGLGNAPVASGTVATLLAGIPCFLLIGSTSALFQFLIALVIFVIGVRVSDAAEREIGQNDPSQVVIDELCGFLVSMIGHPVALPSVCAGFFLFRLFDIWKPWPVHVFESKLKGGLGIMADDVVAGIYANIVGVLLLKFFS